MSQADSRLPMAEAGLLASQGLPPGGPSDQWLDPLELCVGVPIGPVRGVAGLDLEMNQSPREALEQVVLHALLRPPCVVTFSGGRDSSTVLAVATAVARREQLALPIPMTNRFPDLVDADESSWQEVVIRHLGLDDWQRSAWTHELDALGPYSRRAIHEVGIGAPFNKHFILPMIDAAAGGSVLTGMGGDELFFMPARRIANQVRYGHGRLKLRQVRGFLAQQTPAWVRAWLAARSQPINLPWLRAPAAKTVNRRVARDLCAEPIRFDHAVNRWWLSRTSQLSREQLRRLGIAQNVSVEHPFMSRAFLAAFASAHGPQPPSGRARGLRALVGDLLPNEILSRTSKAVFDGAFANYWTRDFVEQWTGRDVPADLVNADALRGEWSSPAPHAGSYLLLQTAWSGQFQGVE